MSVGLRVKIVGNVFYFYAQIGNDTNFEYRQKLIDEIEQSSDASELYTYARGYGDYEDEDTSDNKSEVVNTTDTDKPVIERAKLKREYTSPPR